MKHRKIKVLLLCMAVAGVMAGCGSGNAKEEAPKEAASENMTSSTQENTSIDSGMADKDADGKQEDNEAKADGQTGTPGQTEDKAQDENSADVENMAAEDTAAWIFTNEDLDGNEVTQDIFKDKKLTMVNYWATFCGPCLREMPELGELNKEYADKGFQIVGVVADVMEDKNGQLLNLDTAKDAIEATKAGYVHMPLTQDMLNGPVSSVQVVPTTVFVDENGNLVGEEVLGSKSKEDWAAIIDSYLEKV